MIAFAEQLIYRDVYTTLQPVAPTSGTNVKLFAVQAPATDTVPWAVPPYIVYRLQSDALDREYRSDTVVATILAVRLVAPSTTDLETYVSSVYTRLQGRVSAVSSPVHHTIRYRWMGTQPLSGMTPVQSVQMYRVVVSFS